MTLINWIFLSLIVISAGLYILSLIKKFNLLRIISSCLLLPFTGTFLNLFLIKSLPDSLHTIIVSITALVLLSLAVLFSSFNSNKTLKTILKITYILSLIAWMELYRSVFYIYRVSIFIYILSTVIYTALFITLCIFCGKQKIFYYVNDFLAVFVGFLLNFCSLVQLFYKPGLYSILLFTGTTASIASIALYILNSTKYQIKYYRQINLLILIFSYSSIATANIIMMAV